MAFKKTLAAYTAPGSDFPAYVNVSQRLDADGDVEITVRGEGAGNATGFIRMRGEDFVALLAEAASNLPTRQFLGLLTAYMVQREARVQEGFNEVEYQHRQSRLANRDKAPHYSYDPGEVAVPKRRDRSDPEGGIPGRQP
jgi:hypothetical protein